MLNNAQMTTRYWTAVKRVCDLAPEVDLSGVEAGPLLPCGEDEGVVILCGADEGDVAL